MKKKGINFFQIFIVVFAMCVVAAIVIVFFENIVKKPVEKKGDGFSLQKEVTKRFLLLQPVKISEGAVDIYGLKIDPNAWYLMDLENEHSGLLPVADKPYGSSTTYVESLLAQNTIKVTGATPMSFTTINSEKFKGIDSMVVVLTRNTSIRPYKIGSGHIGIEVKEFSILSN